MRVVVVPSATGAADRALRQTVASVLSISTANTTTGTVCVCVVSNDVALVRLVRRTPLSLSHTTTAGSMGDRQRDQWLPRRVNDEGAIRPLLLKEAPWCVAGGERGAPRRGRADGGEQERRAAQSRGDVMLLAWAARVLQPHKRRGAQRLRETTTQTDNKKRCCCGSAVELRCARWRRRSFIRVAPRRPPPRMPSGEHRTACVADAGFHVARSHVAPAVPGRQDAWYASSGVPGAWTVCARSTRRARQWACDSW